MLLGLDFLKHHNAVLDLLKDEMVIKNEVISLTYGKASEVKMVAKITVCRTTVLPPNTATLLKCKMSNAFDTFVAEPTVDNILVPRAVYCNNTTPKICFINVMDHNVTLKKGQVVANASEAEILPVNDFSQPEVKPEASTIQ